jgi:hypothetical protein
MAGQPLQGTFREKVPHLAVGGSNPAEINPIGSPVTLASLHWSDFVSLEKQNRQDETT